MYLSFKGVTPQALSRSEVHGFVSQSGRKSQMKLPEDGEGSLVGDSDGASIKVAEQPCPCSPPAAKLFKKIAQNRQKLHKIGAQTTNKCRISGGN